MDFTAIYETIAPYIGTSSIALGLITLIGFFFKGINTFKEMKKTFTDTNAEAIDRLKASLPESLVVSLETLTKQELSKIIEQIRETVEKEFIEPIKANDELIKAMAEALALSKLTPDEYKVKIKELLDLPEVETTNSLKVELNTVETTETTKTAENKILVD